MAVEAALLDVDGTLVDSNYQHTLAWYRAIRQHGIVLPIWRKHELREAGAAASVRIGGRTAETAGRDPARLRR